jgi:hypothetical protein
MATREQVPLCDIFGFPLGSVRTQHLKGARLIAFLEERLPPFRQQRLGGRHGEFFEAAADDFFPWKAKALAHTDAGFPNATVVVDDQNGCGRLEDNRAEE